MSDVGLYWLEEPLAPDDYEGYRRLSDADRRADRGRRGRLDVRAFPPARRARWGGRPPAGRLALRRLHGGAGDPRGSRPSGTSRSCRTASRPGSSSPLPCTWRRGSAKPTYSEFSVADSPLAGGLLTSPFELREGRLAVPERPGSRDRPRRRGGRAPPGALMAAIELEAVTKRFPDGTVAVERAEPRRRGRRVHDPRRALGLRQDDGAADGRRARGRDGRRDPHRRPGRERHRAGRPRRRHGLPELRALPPHERARQHRVPAEDAEALRAPRSSSGSTRPRGLLGLDELLRRKPRELSGGQRQRVAMGRAIVRHPQAFLMDEPLSNLDAKLRVQMRAELVKLHRRLGVTTLYVTHDQTEAMTLGQRVAVLRLGVIQQVDAPQRLYHHPANTFVASFIGSPPMNFAAGTLADGFARARPVPLRAAGRGRRQARAAATARCSPGCGPSTSRMRACGRRRRCDAPCRCRDHRAARPRDLRVPPHPGSRGGGGRRASARARGRLRGPPGRALAGRPRRAAGGERRPRGSPPLRPGERRRDPRWLKAPAASRVASAAAGRQACAGDVRADRGRDVLAGLRAGRRRFELPRTQED